MKVKCGNRDGCALGYDREARESHGIFLVLFYKFRASCRNRACAKWALPESPLLSSLLLECAVNVSTTMRAVGLGGRRAGGRALPRPLLSHSHLEPLALAIDRSRGQLCDLTEQRRDLTLGTETARGMALKTLPNER